MNFNLFFRLFLFVVEPPKKVNAAQAKKMSKKLLICSTKDDESNETTSIVNHLCSIAYEKLTIDTATRSPLRIIETTIQSKQIEFWHLTVNRTSSSLPAICTFNLDGLVLIASSNAIQKFLNSNSMLFNKHRRLPILLLSKQSNNSTVLDNMQLQSNYNIKQVNTLNSSLDSIQTEFNNWFVDIYSSN